jgi:hypothetical protein
MSLFTATSRSLVLQQSRQAIRKLFYRVQEGIQIVEPLPGQTARTLLFRDVKNRVVRIRHLQQEKQLITEVWRDGAFVDERHTFQPGDELQGIQIGFCDSALFTALSPGTVCVSFTTFDDRVKESSMTVITLANSRLDR